MVKLDTSLASRGLLTVTTEQVRLPGKVNPRPGGIPPAPASLTGEEFLLLMSDSIQTRGGIEARRGFLSSSEINNPVSVKKQVQSKAEQNITEQNPSVRAK